MLRVALLLSGQPRFYNGESYKSIKKFILDRYNTDVFIHCWYSDSAEYNFAEWSEIRDPLVFPKNTVSDLISLYNPKSIVVQPPLDFCEYSGEDYLSKNMPSMWYSLEMCDAQRREWCKRNPKYDFVIRCRTDTLLLDFPDLCLLSRSSLYIPDNCPNSSVVNDNFSICGGEICDSKNVYRVYDNLWEYSGRGSDFSPELCWYRHLHSNKIDYKLLKFSQSFVRKWI